MNLTERLRRLLAKPDPEPASDDLPDAWERLAKLERDADQRRRLQQLRLNSRKRE